MMGTESAVTASKEALKLKLWDSLCIACDRTHADQTPPFKRCGRCLLTRYCSRECQTRDWRTHKHRCGLSAVNGLVLKLNAALVLDDTENFVRVHRALPEGLTMPQLDDLFAQARLALPHLPGPSEYQCFQRALSLWYTCATVVHPRPAEETKEIFMAALREMPDQTPTDSPLWVDAGLLSIYEQYGHILCNTSPVKAVEWGRRIKPRIEAVLQREQEAGSWSSAGAAVVHFLNQYARWLHLAANEIDERPQGLNWKVFEEVEELEAVLRRAIELGEAVSPMAVEVPELYENLGAILRGRGSIMEALKVSQRGMQVQLERESPYYGQSADHAISCLLELLREEQAEALIHEVMAAGERCPKLLSVSCKASVLNSLGIIQSHRGEYRAAWDTLMAALSLSEAADESGESFPSATSNFTQLQLLEVIDCLGLVDEGSHMEKLRGVKPNLDVSKYYYQPACVARLGAALLADGDADSGMRILREYAEQYRTKGTAWKQRHRWREGGALKPLHVLRDALEEGSEERAQVQELIDRSAGEDEALRRQALEELQAEMGVQRPGEAVGGGGGRSSKAGRKKRKKRKKRRQQQQGREEAVAVAMAGLSLEESTAADDVQAAEEVGGAAAAAEEEADECAVCLAEFDGAQEEEVLGCGHRFHGACMDRWLCKCREKGLAATCPFCRAKVVRGRGSSRV